MNIQRRPDRYAELTTFFITCKKCNNQYVGIIRYSNGGVSIYCPECNNEEILYPGVVPTGVDLLKEREYHISCILEMANRRKAKKDWRLQ